MAVYTTIDGDMVDMICAVHYGTEARYTEAVLDANPGLAAIGPKLPAGVKVVLPEFEPATVAQATKIARLWD